MRLFGGDFRIIDSGSGIAPDSWKLQ